MKKQEELVEFERFAAQHRKELWDQVLKPRREAEGNPNWSPRNWAEGVGYQSQVHKILRGQFYATRRAG